MARNRDNRPDMDFEELRRRHELYKERTRAANPAPAVQPQAPQRAGKAEQPKSVDRPSAPSARAAQQHRVPAEPVPSSSKEGDLFQPADQVLPSESPAPETLGKEENAAPEPVDVEQPEDIAPEPADVEQPEDIAPEPADVEQPEDIAPEPFAGASEASDEEEYALEDEDFLDEDSELDDFDSDGSGNPFGSILSALGKARRMVGGLFQRVGKKRSEELDDADFEEEDFAEEEYDEYDEAFSDSSETAEEPKPASPKRGKAARKASSRQTAVEKEPESDASAEEPDADAAQEVSEEVAEDLPEDSPVEIPEDLPEDVPQEAEEVPEDALEDIPEEIPQDLDPEEYDDFDEDESEEDSSGEENFDEEDFEEEEDEEDGESKLARFVGLFIRREEDSEEDEGSASEEEEDSFFSPIPSDLNTQMQGGDRFMEQRQKISTEMTESMAEGLGERGLSRKERRELALKAQENSKSELEAEEPERVDEPTREFKPVSREKLPAKEEAEEEKPTLLLDEISLFDEEEDEEEESPRKRREQRKRKESRREKKRDYDEDEEDDYDEDEEEYEPPIKKSRKKSRRYEEEDEYDDYDEDEEEYDDYDEDDYEPRRRHSHSRRRDYADYDEDDYDDYDDEYDEDDGPSFGHSLLGFFKGLFGVIIFLLVVILVLNILHYTGTISLTGIKNKISEYSPSLSEKMFFAVGSEESEENSPSGDVVPEQTDSTQNSGDLATVEPVLGTPTPAPVQGEQGETGTIAPAAPGH